MFYPFNEKLSVPLFMFKQTPKTPSFLNLFPYTAPVAFEACLSWPNPELSKWHTIISPAEGMIAKGTIEIKVLGRSDSDFHLVFSAAICDDFPIVHTTAISHIGYCGSENVGLLFEKYIGVALRHNNASAKGGRVPN